MVMQESQANSKNSAVLGRDLRRGGTRAAHQPRSIGRRQRRPYTGKVIVGEAPRWCMLDGTSSYRRKTSINHGSFGVAGTKLGGWRIISLSDVAFAGITET